MNKIKFMRSFIFYTLVIMSYSSHSESWQTAISMYGDLKYNTNFEHFEYVNPNSPKGGVFKQASIGSFDSLNPYIVKGNAAAGINRIYDTLMKQSTDEPFSLYPLVAEKVKVADDYSAVSFLINDQAKFADGVAITAKDIKFSFDLLVSEGAPLYASYYAGVKEVTVDALLQVTFHFKETGNRELPLIIGQVPIFPEHFWKDKEFSKSGLVMPLGSGPYSIKGYDAGKQIVYQRDNHYWGKELPVNKGQFNFDEIIIDYYRDDSVAFEAFKSGAFDYRLESSSKRWSTGYVGEQFDSGKVILEKIEDRNPQGMQGFWFNLRKSKFKDPNVREAISLLFDFEWANKTLFYGAYTRINSFYSGSELATEANISEAEQDILAPYKDQLKPSVFEPIQSNKTLGNGNVRAQMRQAVTLLGKAGYELKNSKMQNKYGEQLSFEFLLYSKDFERVIHPFRRNLQRIGINTSIRLVDIPQFINRLNNFDFDMLSLRKGQSISPGNEQATYWGCETANQVGTANWAGLCSPIVDQLTKQIITATTREELVNTTKALDRVLLSEHMVIPQWFLPASRIAYWNKFEHPEVSPYYDLGIDTWWAKDPKSMIKQESQ